MKNFTLALSLAIFMFTPNINQAQLNNWCAAMDGLQDRLINDEVYATFHEAATSIEQIERNALPCDATNSVIIPLAFHFDDTFSCADVNCLLTKVQEQIDALNYAYADNSSYQQNLDLSAACPTGYPLADVSSGTCIEFRLGVAPAGQGLDPACDPALTIGEFGGGTQTGLGGAGAGWAGYLNIFVVEAVAIYGFPIPGIIGVADGIPGAANGDGITILADAFGGAGAACNSGNDLDIGASDGTSFFFTEGGTVVHEVGHYLGLYHIWGDDQPLFGGTPPFCTGDDSTMPQVGPFVVNDTPLQSEPTPTNAACPTISGATCASLPSSCDGSNDYFHNYMDYSNDVCFSMFTSDQSMVVNYWANQLFAGSSISTYSTVPSQLVTICDMQPCSACASVNLDILFDGFPGQTSWDITDTNGNLVASSGGTYGNQPGNSTLTSNPACLPDGCYDLTFYDTLNNGMCPFQSSAVGVSTFITPGTLITPGTIVGTLSLVANPGLCGNYTLTDGNGGVLASGGGNFGGQQTSNFCISGGVGVPRQGNTNHIISVSPNPAFHQIQIDTHFKKEALNKVQVIDTDGRIVFETSTVVQPNQSINFDVSQFTAGIYVIRFLSDQEKMITKFVKR